MSRYISFFKSLHRPFYYLYRSILLRILVLCIALMCATYYFFVLPWVNKSISEQYFAQTGHQLTHDKINIQLFKCHASIGTLKDSKNLWQAEKLELDIACSQSLRERSLVINYLKLHRFKTTLVQSDAGAWNFDDVIKHVEAVRNQSPKSATQQRPPVLIKSVSLSDASVHSELQNLKELPLDLVSINVKVENLDFRASAPSNISLNAILNKTASIALLGKLNVSNASGSLDINTQHIPFVWFNSLLKPYLRLEVLGGEFEMRNHIDVVSGKPSNIVSHGSLSNLKLRPTTMEQDVVKWKSLEWKNAAIQLAEKRISIPLVELSELDGQFIIDKNRKTNVQAMIISSTADAKQKASSGSESETPWQFNIERFSVKNAAVGFYDQSLTPSFSAIVQHFTGDIQNISTDKSSLATIDLKGNVDGYAPVYLKGSANMFIPVPRLDVLLSFKQLDMGALSPYSAEYAGWKINKGLLSADLNYHYENGKILGKNHIVIDHLEFGEKVRGTRVIDIPLRLGLAMLTDSNGIAVLDTEISGTPDDPQFKLRDIIVRALTNTLKKILSSPFRFIASLLDTKEELGKIEFTAGESQLSEQAKQRLHLLADALVKRPKMRLSVLGTYDQQADQIALKEEQVKSALQKAGVNQESMKARDSVWVEAVKAKFTNTTPVSGNSNLSADEMYQSLITSEIVDSERLLRLAHERAQAVKQYFILQLGISGDAILLDSDTRCEKGAQCSSSEAIFTLEV